MLRAVAGGGSGGGGGGGTIGGAVTGGTAGSVLFVDGSEKLGQDNPDFTYISDRLSTPFLSVTGNGAASVSPFLKTGTVFTGGSTTTTLPYELHQPTSASAVTTWSTSGTVLGMNLASGFAGNFVDFHVNGGASVFSVSYTGAISGATLSGASLTSATLGSGVGFSATSYSGGTISSGTYTPASTNGNFQHITNGGAFTLAPPSTVCTIIVEVLNNGSAGTITTSGFTKVTGDALTTTNGSKFQCFITKSQNYSSLNVVALQ